MKNNTTVAEVQGTKAAIQTSKSPELSNLAVAPKQTPKPEESTTKTKVLTVEDRKGRTEVFTKLLDKHENLKDVQKRLESFAVGSDEHSQALSLKDSKGNSFQTGNPLLLKEVIQLIRVQVTTQVGVIEDDILNFII
jgi:hypothetical protein